MKTIKTAIIAAGGEGRRMKKQNITLPKPLVKFKNKPLITYIIDSLIKNNITKIIILEPYNYSLKEELNLMYHDINLIFIKPKKKQPLFENLLLAKRYITESFLLTDSDIIVNPEDISIFLENLKDKEYYGAIAAVKKPKYQNNHYLTIKDEQIIEFNKDNQIGIHGGYLYILNPKILNKIKHEILINNYSFSSLITKISQKETIMPSYINDIFDIDSYEELESIEKKYN